RVARESRTIRPRRCCYHKLLFASSAVGSESDWASTDSVGRRLPLRPDRQGARVNNALADLKSLPYCFEGASEARQIFTFDIFTFRPLRDIFCCPCQFADTGESNWERAEATVSRLA